MNATSQNPMREAAGLLRAIAMPEPTARNLEEYEALALKPTPAEKPPAAFRTKLQRNPLSTPLFDTERFGRNLEAVFRELRGIRRGGPTRHPFAGEFRE